MKKQSDRALLVFLPILLLVCCSSGESAASGTGVGDAIIIPVTIRGYHLDVEVADTLEKVQRGLMYRKHLPENRGMLFLYPVEQELSFWMKNTYLPLSIAFLDKNGRIMEIQEMKPLDDTLRYRSGGKAKYAIEVNQGWFRERNIGPGSMVYFRIPPKNPNFDY